MTAEQRVRLLARLAGVPEERAFVHAGSAAGTLQPRQYFPFRDHPCWVNDEKLRTTGWAPTFDLEEGFRQTLASHDVGDLARRAIERCKDIVLDRLGAP